MSYQMLTTKRKFDRLLDQIANAGYANSLSPAGLPQDGISTAVSSAMEFSERTTKRRKVVPSMAKPFLQQRSNFVKSSPQLLLLLTQQARTIRSLKEKALTEEEVTDMAEDSFSPASQKTFLDRLKSFSHVLHWSTKPEVMNEVAWAKRGWRLVGPETVCCDTCQQFVVIDMASNHAEPTAGEDTSIEGMAEAFSLRQTLGLRYAENIVSRHIDGCPWKIMGCGDSVRRVRLWPADQGIRDLLVRYKHLMAKSNALPNVVVFDTALIDINVSFNALLSLHPDEAEGLNLPDDALPPFDESSSPSDPRLRAVGLALAGWDVKDTNSGDSHVYVSCDMCFRRVGLWLYKPMPIEPITEAGKTGIKDFNIVDEHRDHCPWRNNTVQCPTDISIAPRQTATKQLGSSLFNSALSKARQQGEYSGAMTAFVPTGQPVDPALSSSQEESSAPQENSQNDNDEQALIERGDSERREKLKGIRKFFAKFQNIGGKRHGHGGQGGSGAGTGIA